MMWEWGDYEDAIPESDQPEPDSHLNFDFFSTLAKPKDYYKILEVDYDATDDDIRSNYIRLALKWHPDKQKDQDCTTSRFQDINEAYQEVFMKKISKEILFAFSRTKMFRELFLFCLICA
ncbi:DnaJ protein [Vigna angularis]|uniref:DnaJ protein n=1 Tax=Phaseolus angularis TaxID=3914 RepID=A0A8T0JY34_PHAAN|nr:DnaJ protein [Vigna angularis]